MYLPFLSPTVIYGPQCEKICLRGFVNNKGTYQPGHPHSLISAFVICLLESIISRLATSIITNFLLVSVAKQACLGKTWPQGYKT